MCALAGSLAGMAHSADTEQHSPSAPIRPVWSGQSDKGGQPAACWQRQVSGSLICVINFSTTLEKPNTLTTHAGPQMLDWNIFGVALIYGILTRVKTNIQAFDMLKGSFHKDAMHDCGALIHTGLVVMESSGGSSCRWSWCSQSHCLWGWCWLWRSSFCLWEGGQSSSDVRIKWVCPEETQF